MLEFSPLCLKRLNKDGIFSSILNSVDSVHLDIMDGDFVPNKAFSVSDINEFKCNIPKHVHIMSWDPMQYIKDLVNIDSISFHYEVGGCRNIIQSIKDKQIRVGLVVNPKTPINEILKYIPLLDRVIVMAVEPGYSAQEYLPSTSQKIIELRKMSADIEIVVDGGMNEQTIDEVRILGVDAFVVCSVIAKSKDIEGKIEELHGIWNNKLIKKVIN
jgi:ribulose-phosphate 3-epimerase